MEFIYTSKAPNLTATFAVIWGGSKPLDNPDNIHGKHDTNIQKNIKSVYDMPQTKLKFIILLIIFQLLSIVAAICVTVVEHA